jgi:hypothetical protein
MKRFLLLISISGCTHTMVVTKLETVTPTLPDSLFQVEPPPSPVGVKTDGDFANWGMNSWIDANSCFLHVAAIKTALQKTATGTQ